MAGRYKGREWAPISLDVIRHPDLAAATAEAPAAFGLFIASILWSIDNDTQGHLPTYAVDRLVAGLSREQTDAAVAALARHGRLEPTLDGWTIHHFLEHQGKTVEARTRYQNSRNGTAE